MHGRVVFVLGVVAIALALVALFGPWWVVDFHSVTHIGTSTGETWYGFFGSTTTSQNTGLLNGSTTDSSDYRQLPNVGAVFLFGSLLTALGALSGAALVGVTGMPGLTRRLRRLRVLLSVFAVVLTVATPIYVMARLPGAFTQDAASIGRFVQLSSFWGSGSGGMLDFYVSLSWGADWAWYAVLAAAVLFLIDGILIFRARGPSSEQTTPHAARGP